MPLIYQPSVYVLRKYLHSAHMCALMTPQTTTWKAAPGPQAAANGPSRDPLTAPLNLADRHQVRNWVSNVVYIGDIFPKEMQPSYHPIPLYSFCPDSPPHFSTTPVSFSLASCYAFIIPGPHGTSTPRLCGREIRQRYIAITAVH